MRCDLVERSKSSCAAMKPIPPGAHMLSLTRRAITTSLTEKKKSTNVFMIFLWKRHSHTGKDLQSRK